VSAHVTLSAITLWRLATGGMDRQKPPVSFGPRATGARRRNGRFSGRRWSSSSQPAAVDWGRGTEHLLLNEFAAAVLAAAGW